MPNAVKLSPGRRQYLRLKQDHPDALLLVRMGDFYETFDDDARLMARVLDIALTARDVGGGVKAPLAGIPHHSLESHLGRLVRAGLRVAICEQISDPATSKGIVDRAVVRLVTPGTVVEPGLLDQTVNNYLAAVVANDSSAGLAWVDITTSEFMTMEVDTVAVRDEFERLRPAEALVNNAARALLGEDRSRLCALRELDESRLDAELAGEAVKRHFGALTLEPYGCQGRPAATMAAAAILEYLAETQLGALPQITDLRTVPDSSFMTLDRHACRDLELFEPMGGRAGSGTLLSTLDRSRTPMGGRMMRSWLARPLLDLASLSRRQAAVRFFVENAPVRMNVREALARIPDLERLLNRVRTFSAGPRDVAALGRGLAQIPLALDMLARHGNGSEPPPGAGLKPIPDAVALIQAAIADDPSLSAGDGGAIRRGFDPALDDALMLSGEARSSIAAIEGHARDATGIKNLKVGYNRIFGYYIEVSRANLERVPPEFERRQTLVNGERFITPELKEYESKILNARDRIGELERAAFRRVCGELAGYGDRIMASARALAEIDVLSALADVAATHGYICPQLHEEDSIEIKAGRHPVVEAALGPGRFVPNDTCLSSSAAQVAIITGPNMSGKSTYIRQVAVLTLMAQIGSFIPAESASIGLVDRIFTRAGLSDDIAGGQSTFMVEMVETATILNQATSRSLVILDEIGRGTSTYDGLAIARAVAEHIHNSPRLGCKTLFATHYHEMTALAEMLPRAVNYRVTVSEERGAVVFLHRIAPGGADKSYGVHVGRLAGLPQQVINRAWDILSELESSASSRRDRSTRPTGGVQLPLMAGPSPTEQALLGLDIQAMTPLDALNELYRLQEQARRDAG